MRTLALLLRPFCVAPVALAAALAGCVVNDELKDGLREMRGEVTKADLLLAPDGTGTLKFRFDYGIALVDKSGIEGFPWEYRLVDSARNLLASNSQIMRKPEPTETRVLVTGNRERTLEVPAGRVRPGETYALWIVVQYRGETVTEVLAPVTEGAPTGTGELADATSITVDVAATDAGATTLTYTAD